MLKIGIGLVLVLSQDQNRLIKAKLSQRYSLQNMKKETLSLQDYCVSELRQLSCIWTTLSMDGYMKINFNSSPMTISSTALTNECPEFSGRFNL